MSCISGHFKCPTALVIRPTSGEISTTSSSQAHHVPALDQQLLKFFLRGPSRSYLHRDFESIQGGSAGPRNRSCSSTCDQMSPPHPSLLLLNGEVIGDHEILSNIEYLIRRWQEWSDIESKKPLVEVLVILSRQLTEITLIMETYMKRLQRTEWRLVSRGPLLNILEQDPFCVKLLFLTNMW